VTLFNKTHYLLLAIFS